MQFGCSGSRSYDPAIALRVRSRTTTEFARGTYYKPGDHGLVGLEQLLVPLIVDETVSKKPEASSLICTPAREGGCDSGVSTVYCAASKVAIDGQSYDQVLYVWFYQSGVEDVSGRGVRVVMGHDGFPMFWEALDSGESGHVLYVSRGIEDRAIAEFGSPLFSRKFAIERSVREAPEVVVARVLDDGPVAMGPWVYVGGEPSREIVTFLCRCMPSQVDGFVRTIKYELQPLEAIPLGFRSDWFRELLSVDDLTGVLRWPVGD